MKKVALICVMLVCMTIFAAGSVTFNVSGTQTKAASSTNNAAQPKSTVSEAHIVSKTPINPLKLSARNANQLSRRQAYSGPFCASSKSLTQKYHFPRCFEVANIDPENLVTFNTISEACTAGYQPCLRCNPPSCTGVS